MKATDVNELALFNRQRVGSRRSVIEASSFSRHSARNENHVQAIVTIDRLSQSCTCFSKFSSTLSLKHNRSSIDINLKNESYSYLLLLYNFEPMKVKVRIKNQTGRA